MDSLFDCDVYIQKNRAICLAAKSCVNLFNRNFHDEELVNIITQVAEMDREKLLQDRTQENKDPQTILVNTWYLKLNAILLILKKITSI